MGIVKNKALQGVFAFAGTVLFLLASVSFLNVPAPVGRGMVLGIGLAFLNGLLSLLSIHWTFYRSAKIFFGTFFAGMLWKLAVLGAAFFYLMGKDTIQAASALAALGAVTLILNILEVRFLPQLKNGL